MLMEKKAVYLKWQLSPEKGIAWLVQFNGCPS
jgi:hypothetical protein